MKVYGDVAVKSGTARREDRNHVRRLRRRLTLKAPYSGTDQVFVLIGQRSGATSATPHSWRAGLLSRLERTGLPAHRHAPWLTAPLRSRPATGLCEMLEILTVPRARIELA